MVAGGFRSDSTELLRPGASSWTTAASLLYEAWGLRSASLAGSLYLSGGRYGEYGQYPHISGSF